jgi:hypothetical protein
MVRSPFFKVLLAIRYWLLVADYFLMVDYKPSGV